MYNLSHGDTALLTWAAAAQTLLDPHVSADFVRQPLAYIEGCVYMLAQFEVAQQFADSIRVWDGRLRMWWFRTVYPFVVRYRNHAQASTNTSAPGVSVVSVVSGVRSGGQAFTTWLSNASAIAALVDSGAPVVQWAFAASQATALHTGNQSGDAPQFHESHAVPTLRTGPTPAVRATARRLLQQVTDGAFASGWPLNWNAKNKWQAQSGPVCELYDIASVS
eukprot:1227636-Rhodomonas_salina.1